MKHSIFFLILGVLLMQSCSKDKPIEPSSTECKPLPPSPAIGWNYIFRGIRYTAPCFNPNNPNEIIFREHNYTNGEFWLCKLNLVTKEKEYIYEGSFNSIPQWGKNDWIIFTLSDLNIYKIRSTGVELTQLTDNGKSFIPVWSFDYEKIYFNSFINYKDSSGKGHHRGIFINIDPDGNILDTIFEENWLYYSSNLAASLNQYYLKIYNVELDTIITLLTFDPNLGTPLNGIFWLDKNTLIWYRRDGIFKTDIKTAVTHQVKSTCNSNYFMNPTYSSQINKIIWHNVIMIPKGDYLENESKFVKMNPDGTDEEIIQLPN